MRAELKSVLWFFWLRISHDLIPPKATVNPMRTKFLPTKRITRSLITEKGRTTRIPSKPARLRWVNSLLVKTRASCDNSTTNLRSSRLDQSTRHGKERGRQICFGAAINANLSVLGKGSTLNFSFDALSKSSDPIGSSKQNGSSTFMI